MDFINEVRTLALRFQRVTALLFLLLFTPVIFVTYSPVSADCKYKFGGTKECAPIQSLSIDRIDFEIVATERSFTNGTAYPGCLGRLYIEGGNVAQFAYLDQTMRVTFGRGSLSSRFPSATHSMMPSTLRPGALETSEWIVVNRSYGFEYVSSTQYWDFQPYSREWWVNFNEDHRTIPVSLYYSHDRYGAITYRSATNHESFGYEAVQVPLPDVLLGFDAALTECKKEIVARLDTRVQDFAHRQNIATAEAKIAGAKALKEYYESQMEPLQAQIDELNAIMTLALAALEDVSKAHQRLLERKAEYVKLMEEFSQAESEQYARLFLAVESAQRAIFTSAIKVEQNRADIQANIDGINTMIADINADIAEASNNLREAERDLETLTNQ